MTSFVRGRVRGALATAAGALLVVACGESEVPELAPAPVEAAAVDVLRPEADGQRPLQFADRGPEVRRLYEYLRTFGYFPNPDLHEYAGWTPVVEHVPADPELFDEDIEQALFLYQLAQGLHASGTLDVETAALMQQPRCGFPDYYSPAVLGPQPGGVANFVSSGYKWSKYDLTYSFLNFTGDLPSSNIRADIRGAFNRWAAVTPLRFTEVGGGGDLQIGFYHGDHGDGFPFDAQWGVLAHAFYPSNGRAHFDDAEAWSQNGSGIDLASVAIHEFGHSIGLNHSASSSAVMYSAYTQIRRNLTDDDIFGAKAIYGHKPIAWSSAGPIGGRTCVQIHEGSDPHTWQDNYLCTTGNEGIRWSSAGAIGGMRCTQIHEGAEPGGHTWNDNYLCVPHSSGLYFSWSTAGPIHGKTCTQWHEASDPHTWMDNYLCY